jgi:biopolymer transport protein ExbD
MKIRLPLPRKVRIEMIPLIDIVFLLLVFFIYAMLSMAVHKGLPVELPISAAAELEKELVLSITIQQGPEGGEHIFVNKNEVGLADLADRLRAEAEAITQPGKEPGVLLFADNTISYQQLFRVLDQIRMAGLGRVSLQAREAGR